MKKEIKTKCYLNWISPTGNPINQCCCKCQHHLIDYEHCSINTKLRDKTGSCICNIQKGWICVNPEIFKGKGGASGWPEHSIGCEVYLKKGE